MASIVSADMVRSIAPDPIVFSLANSVSEIMPAAVKTAGAAVFVPEDQIFPTRSTACSCSPACFVGCLASAREIDHTMLIAATRELEGLVGADDNVILSVLDCHVCLAIAAAVADAERRSGMVRG